MHFYYQVKIDFCVDRSNEDSHPQTLLSPFLSFKGLEAKSYPPVYILFTVNLSLFLSIVNYSSQAPSFSFNNTHTHILLYTLAQTFKLTQPCSHTHAQVHKNGFSADHHQEDFSSFHSCRQERRKLSRTSFKFQELFHWSLICIDKPLIESVVLVGNFEWWPDRFVMYVQDQLLSVIESHR